ncbi:MAG: hypothetical protein AAB654_12990 [Acidobacteriota bacterium]
MKAKHLILTLSLTLSAGAAVAAITYGHTEPVTAAPAVATSMTVIPRVVVTASRIQAADAPIARIVIVGHRADASQKVARGNRSAAGA